MRKSIDKLLSDSNYRNMYLSYRRSQGEYRDSLPFKIDEQGNFVKNTEKTLPKYSNELARILD